MSSSIALTATRPVMSWAVAAIEPIVAREAQVEAVDGPPATQFPPGRAPLAPAAMATLIHAQALISGQALPRFGYARAA